MMQSITTAGILLCMILQTSVLKADARDVSESGWGSTETEACANAKEAIEAHGKVEWHGSCNCDYDKERETWFCEATSTVYDD